MGKIKQISINQYDGGIAFDTRSAAASQFSTAINFDIFKKPSTLSPIRSIEADQNYSGTDGLKSYKVTAFGSSYDQNTVYGWGRKTTSNTGLKLFKKNPIDASWVAGTGIVSGALGQPIEAEDGCPVPGSRVISTFNSSGAQTLWSITNDNNTLTSGTRYLTTVSEITGTNSDFKKKALSTAAEVSSRGIEPNIILGSDGNAYVYDANKVHRCNVAGTVTADVLVFTSNIIITSACLWGSYLAFSIKAFGESRLVLWDYVDSQVAESVNLGEGTAMVIENLNGNLFIIMDKYVNTTVNGTGSSNGQGSMQIKSWGGGQVVNTLTEYKAGGVLAGATKNYHFKKNNAIYWYAKIPLDATPSTYAEGIWAFGRVTSSQPFALSLHREVPTNFISFHMQGDYTYFAHGTDGSVSRTADDEAYTLTSSYETLIIDDNQPTQLKQFLEAKVSFEKLTAGQTVVLKYRKDGATAWTTVSPIPAIVSGDLSASYPMDGNFRECQFRIESTGGAKINTFQLQYEEIA